jgi:hypothetical protein
MKPITGRDPLALLAQVEAEHGKQTADAVADVMIAQALAEKAELEARIDQLVTEYPALKSVSRRKER